MRGESNSLGKFIIEEAPLDGISYIRSDGEWKNIATSSEIVNNYLALSGGNLNNDSEIVLTKYGSRTLTLTGNDIGFDFSKDTGGWAATVVKVTDPIQEVTQVIGLFGGTGGLEYVYMGGSYSDPFMKMTKDGQFTFKITPKVGTESVVLQSSISDMLTKTEASSTYITETKLNEAINSAIITAINGNY